MLRGFRNIWNIAWAAFVLAVPRRRSCIDYARLHIDSGGDETIHCFLHSGHPVRFNKRGEYFGACNAYFLIEAVNTGFNVDLEGIVHGFLYIIQVDYEYDGDGARQHAWAA
jgi:hypothetical protein